MTKPPQDSSFSEGPPQARSENASQTRRQSAKSFRFEYLVHDVSRIRRTVMDQAMRPLGITRSQWSVLTTLSRGGNDGMMQVDLARLLEIGKVTVGGLVDRLETTGHVERRSDPTDRRVKRVFITPQGFGMLAEMIAVAGRLNDRILENVSRKERQQCEEVLYAVKQNLRELLQEINGNTPELHIEPRDLDLADATALDAAQLPEDQAIVSGKP